MKITLFAFFEKTCEIKKKGKKEEEDEHMDANSFIPLHTTLELT